MKGKSPCTIAKHKSKLATRALCAVLSAVMVLSMAACGPKAVPQEGAFTTVPAGGTISLTGGASYTVAPKDMTAERCAKIVAAVGIQDAQGALTEKNELNNAELNMYYWDLVYNFYQSYYYYLLYSGVELDLTYLDTTACTMSQGQSWQEYFLSATLDQYRRQTAILKKARSEGFTLTEAEQKNFDDTVKAIRETATIQEDIEAYYGPGITLEDYLAYWEDQYYYAVYVAYMMDQVQYTDEILSDFYDAHRADYENLRIIKDDRPVVHIRHILIEPADNAVDADWTAAEQKAQEVYNTWCNGEKTEDSFAALAKEHSADGNKEQGGLYENVHPGQMVQEFEDWCFAEERKEGDSGIVKTPYGYHIMYFVKEGEYIYWKEQARADYVSEENNHRINEEVAKYTMEYNTALINLSLPGQILNQAQ